MMEKEIAGNVGQNEAIWALELALLRIIYKRNIK